MIVNVYGKGGGSYLGTGDHLVHIFEVVDNDKTAKPSVDVLFKSDTGQTVKDTFWMTEDAQWRIANLAIACGFAKDQNDDKLKKLNTQSLCGREVMIRVAKEASKKNGKMYSVVKAFWKPSGEAPGMPATDEEEGRDDGGFESYEKGKEDPF